jgi:hypothetical protein
MSPRTTGRPAMSRRPAPCENFLHVIKGGPLRVPPRPRPAAPGVRPLRADPAHGPGRTGSEQPPEAREEDDTWAGAVPLLRGQSADSTARVKPSR